MLMLMFQSTRPRGARHVLDVIYTQDSMGFNPRARVGRDYIRIVEDTTYTAGFNPRARVGRDKRQSR